jgi:hypothetical protein
VKKHKNFILGALGIALVLGLLGYQRIASYFKGDSGAGEAFGIPCVNPLLPIPPQYHIHPKLKIVIEGSEVPLAPNVGLGLAKCERALHTHDASGELHIEPNFYQEFTLDQFFKLWGKSFSREEILDKRASDTHEIVMTVDGKPSEEFEKLILKDKQEIVIEYRERKP